MRFRTLVFFLTVATGLPSQAAETQNLVQIYQQALAHDPIWASAQSGRLATQEKLAQGNAQLLPTVSFNAGVSEVQADTKFLGSSSVLQGCKVIKIVFNFRAIGHIETNGAKYRFNAGDGECDRV